MSARYWCDTCAAFVQHETSGHPSLSAPIVVRDAQIDCLRRKNSELTAQLAALAEAAVEKWKYQTHCLLCGISANHGNFKHAAKCVLANLPSQGKALLDLTEAAREACEARRTVDREQAAFKDTGRTASKERLEQAMDRLGEKLAAWRPE